MDFLRASGLSMVSHICGGIDQAYSLSVNRQKSHPVVNTKMCVKTFAANLLGYTDNKHCGCHTDPSAIHSDAVSEDN